MELRENAITPSVSGLTPPLPLARACEDGGVMLQPGRTNPASAAVSATVQCSEYNLGRSESKQAFDAKLRTLPRLPWTREARGRDSRLGDCGGATHLAPLSRIITEGWFGHARQLLTIVMCLVIALAPQTMDFSHGIAPQIVLQKSAFLPGGAQMPRDSCGNCFR